ncbi:MAG: alpha-glucosidase C-terminal domain-containing protein [Anaerolineae bacterium]|nr:alpha-glucosidase C-terminal domain-containing protein [Anaerolineae bacterium]
MVNTLSNANTRKLRAGKPFHLPPAAQPLRSTVQLVLEDLKSKVDPVVMLTDVRRNYDWQVVMQPDDAAKNRWTATLMLPAEPTIVKYHFLVGETKIQESRQAEGHNQPIYGEWLDVDFKIAVYDPAGMPADWTQGMMIYQIFPDRFATSDPNRPLVSGGVYGMEAKFMQWGDIPEIPPTGRDFFGGDLRGLIQKLDYLQELGVEVLYLNPIFEASTNHRYEAINFMKIDPMLGTEADFDDLIHEAHARKIKIVLDAVFNHCSSDSIYFDITGKQSALTGIPGATQSKQSPYYRWFKFKEWPTAYDGWWGFGFMPEFVECPEMEEYFLGENGVTRHWLRKGIDGWRCDVSFDNTEDFWKRFRKAVDAEKPGAYTVSEEWRDSTHYLLGDEYNATMNYRFTWMVRGYLATDDLLPSELDDRLQVWMRDTPAPAIKAQMNLLDSHDTDRLFSACGGNRQRYLQAISFQLAYPGSPCIYYGAETGLEGAYAEDGRRCMPWDALDTELHDFFKHAIITRNASLALRLGEVETMLIDDAQRVYAFARRYGAETVYVVFNGSENQAQVELPLSGEEDGTFRDLLRLQPAVTAAEGKLSLILPGHSMAWYSR